MNNSNSQRTFEQLAEEFAERYRGGEQPDITDYAKRYPHYADQMHDLFPALLMMEDIAPDSHDFADSSLEPLCIADQHLPARIGDYRIIREAGRGGMGIVYEAEQVSLARHVALKVLPELADGKQKRRFEREAKAAAKLHHTNIVPVFGVGETDGLSYYVMQFIQGLGLDEVVNELKQLQNADESSATSPGELKVSRVSHLSEPRVANSSVAECDVSAAAVARSLMAGKLDELLDAVESSGYGSGDATLRHDGSSEQAAARANDVTAHRNTATSNRGSSPPDVSSSAVVSSRAFSLSHSSSSGSGSGSGHTLSSVGKGKSRSYFQSVAHIGQQIADALSYAHGQGILHRDIKPGNILLDLRGTAWVTDFGLAKANDQQDITHTGDILGTLRYMPPEAFEASAGALGDIYSLGLTLYELLALRPAFSNRDRQHLIKRITTGELERLDSLNPDLPRDLVTIVHKAIERNPEDRYQSAGELAEDLQRSLDDEPIKARRLTLVERFVRWSRRNRGLAASLAAVAGLLLFLAVAGPIVALRQQQLGEYARWQAYLANMRVASSAMQMGNATLARQSLEAASVEHRDWEWWHFEKRLDGSAQVLKGHAAGIHGIRFVPNDKQFLSISADGTVRRWRYDGPLSTVTSQTLIETGSALENLDVSPDGRRFVFSEDETVYLFDTKSGEKIAESMATGQIEASMAFSPDSRCFVSFSQRGYNTLSQWTSNDGTAAGSFTAEGLQIHRADWDPHGRFVAVGLDQGAVFLLDPENLGLAQKLSAPGSSAPVKAIGVSPTGNQLATGTGWPSNSVRLWNLPESESKRLLGHKNVVDAVVFSPDGSRLVSISIDQTGRLWDTRTRELIAILDKHTEELNDEVRFSPDGERLFTCSRDKTVRIWNAKTGDPVSALLGHRDGVFYFDISSDGRVLASGDGQGAIRLWDLEAMDQSVIRGHTSFIYDCDISADGRLIASCGWDSSLRICDANSGKLERIWNPLSSEHETFDPIPICQSVIHPNGQQIAVGVASSQGIWSTEGPHGRSSAIHLVDLTPNRRDLRIPIPEGLSDRKCLGFDDSGKYLAGGTRSSEVRVWDPADGGLLREWKEIGETIEAVCYDRTGDLLFVGDSDGSIVCLHTHRDGNKRRIGKHDSNLTALAVSPDNRFLASSSVDQTVRIWTVPAGNHVATLEHHARVYDLAFHPTGSRLATGAADNMIRLWDTATWDEVAQIGGHDDFVHGLAFSRDGTRLVSGSGDFTVRIWEGRAPADVVVPRNRR